MTTVPLQRKAGKDVQANKWQTRDAQNCREIGAEAFKGTGLKQIRLDKDCDIAENAFSGCGTVYVFAMAGGSTRDFCNAHNNLVFVEIQ